MKNRLIKTSLTLAVSVWSAAALAASTTTQVVAPTNNAANTSTAAATSAEAPKAKLPVGLSVTSWLYGSTLEAPGKSFSSDDSIGAQTGINSEHVVAAPITIDAKTKITPNFNFLYQFNDSPSDPTSLSGYSLKDPYLKLSRSGVVDTMINGNAVNLGGDLRYYAPLSKGSRDTNSAGSVRLSVNPGLQIGKSRWSVSAVNYVRYYIQPEGDVYNVRRWFLYTGPQVNFEATESVTAWLLLEATEQTRTQFGTMRKSEKASLVDLEPGVTFKIGNNIELSPYLNWYTNQDIKTTSINLNASITLL